MNYPDGFVIRKTGTVKTGADGPEHGYDYTFDFSDCPIEIVAKFAVRGMTIDQQRRDRKALSNGERPKPVTINVGQTIVSGRTVLMVREPTREEILEQAAGMTSEQLRKILADVEAREEGNG